MVPVNAPQTGNGSREYRRRRLPDRRPGFLRDLLIFCVAFGFLFLVISDANYQRSTSVNPVLILPQAISAMLARASLALLLLAAVAGVFLLPNTTLPEGYTLLWCVYCAYSVYLAIEGLGFGGLLTSRVFADMAPGVAVASGLMFLGASPRYWPYALKLLRYAAFAAAVLVCVEVARMGMVSRPEAYARYFTYESILEACALVPVGYDAVTRGRARLVSWFPFLVLGLAAIVMQTRLIFIVMAFSLGLVFVLAGRRRRRMTDALPFLFLALGFLLSLLLSFDSGIIGESGRQFWARRFEDTRSGQAQAYFNRVPVKDLLIGVGIPPEGAYTGEGADGIDLGYVNIAYFGGVPAVVLFALLHLAPALRSLKYKLDPVDAVCVATVLAYGVRLFSSTVPSLRPQFILTLFLVGRCAAIASRRQLRFRIAPVSTGVSL